MTSHFAEWRHSFLAFTDRHPLLVYTLFAFTLIWFSQFGAAKLVYLTGYIRDTDDAMRLMQVRDFLSGQSWFDVHQYRVNSPNGLLMHWSRLVDVPVALLIAFFKLFTGADMAERLARLVWPALMQFSIFAVLLAITMKLAGKQALFAASVLLGFNLIISMQMEPGRIDHNSAMMLLSALLIYLTLKAREHPRFALRAGACGGFMITVGFETLPLLTIVSLFYVLMWLKRQPNAGPLLRNFGLSFALSTLTLYFATTPPSLYQTLACDAQSYVSTMLAVVAGSFCLLLYALEARLTTLTQRLFAAALCLAILGLLFYFYAKPCFAGPFAIVPEDIREKWMSKIFEVVGLSTHLKNDLFNNLPYVGPLAVSLACALATFYIVRNERWRWGLMAALVALYAALTFLHLREASYAMFLALPASAWCLTRLRETSQAGMALLYVLLIPSAWAFAVKPFAKPLPEISRCGDPESYATVAQLQKGRVLAPIDLGPFLLVHTKHSAFGAPYHRNVDGMRYVFATLFEPPAIALPKLREKKIDYVILCEKMGEQSDLDLNYPQSLGTQLMKGKNFPALVKIDTKAPLHVWRVR